MKNQPSITVIIPAKNEEKTVGQIVDSVKKYANEIIVVEGHSEDNIIKYSAKRGSEEVPQAIKGGLV